jgi:hypothetical protein
MSTARFPAPWSAVEIPGGFRVQDAGRSHIFTAAMIPT